MAVQNFELLNTNTDVTTTRTLLHEAIPVTGAIVSGTYNEENIKNYTHGQFQSVYDYPYLSSSANHIFDLAAGYDSITLGVGKWADPMNTRVTLTDASASSTGEGTANTNGGDYGVLYNSADDDGTAYGVVFYQTGLAILSASIFTGSAAAGVSGHFIVPLTATSLTARNI